MPIAQRFQGNRIAVIEQDDKQRYSFTIFPDKESYNISSFNHTIATYAYVNSTVVPPITAVVSWLNQGKKVNLDHLLSF